MPLPLLNTKTLYTFPVNQSVLPLCGFRSDEIDYIGIQPSAWESSENSWDNGDPAYGSNITRDPMRGYGKWFGPGAVWVYADNLAIAGKMESLDYDDIARISSGGDAGTTMATWERANAGFIEATGEWRVILQSADGSFLHNDTQAESTFTVPALSANAVLWVRLENAIRQWQMPPDYLEVTGYGRIPQEYMYQEEGVDYVWDYIYDVGRRPTDTSNPLYAAYNQAQQAGLLKHRSLWTQYISDGTAQGGNWSALRIAVDSDPFAVESTFVPAPGSCMINAAGDDIFIHATAASVAVYNKIPNGERISGTIATTKGVAVAYWDWNSGAPDLLAVNYNIGTMICESSLYPTPDSIIQLNDGTELLLTWSYLFRYDATQTAIQDRLIGIPLNVGGHPGGRCLTSADGVDPSYFTENFNSGATTMGATGGTGFIQMYNTLRTLDGSASGKTGIGTVFHGNNCADLCWGNLWGWVQDGVWSDGEGNALNPNQYLAFIANEMWEASSIAPFSTENQMWQRVARVANKNGQRLIVSGKERNGEKAVWGIHDGSTFTFASLNFRPRRFTPIQDEDGNNWLYIIGRPTELADDEMWDVTNTWQLIRISGDIKKQCFTYDTDAFKAATSDVTAAGIDIAELPPYLKWTQAPCDGGGYWLPSADIPGSPYLTLANNGTTVSWTLTGTAPYDFDVWSCICVPIYDDGSIGNNAIIPDACAINNASDALAVMPAGTKVLITGDAVVGTWDAIQVDDANDVQSNGSRLMEEVRLSYPCLWCRFDSTADVDDLTTYDTRLNFGQFQSLPDTAKTRVQVCILVPHSLGTVRAQVVAPR